MCKRFLRQSKRVLFAVLFLFSMINVTAAGSGSGGSGVVSGYIPIVKFVYDDKDKDKGKGRISFRETPKKLKTYLYHYNSKDSKEKKIAKVSTLLKKMGWPSVKKEEGYFGYIKKYSHTDHRGRTFNVTGVVRESLPFKENDSTIEQEKLAENFLKKIEHLDVPKFSLEELKKLSKDGKFNLYFLNSDSGESEPNTIFFDSSKKLTSFLPESLHKGLTSSLKDALEEEKAPSNLGVFVFLVGVPFLLYGLHIFSSSQQEEVDIYY